MVFIVIFLFEVAFLFFLSRILTRSLYFLPINLISFLFLPGIIVHELSHLFIASLLFVPAGDIEFMPQVGEGGLKLGSVSIAETDPVRRFLIGVSPTVVGLSLILGIFYFLSLNGVGSFVEVIIAAYILFAVGNTMFSSKKDMEGALVLLVFAVIMILAFYFAGLRVNFSFLQTSAFLKTLENFRQIDLYLVALIAIDGVIFLLIKLLRR